MAKIKGKCPHCGADNRYDRTAAGLYVTCPECGGRFQLDYARSPHRGCLSSCFTTVLVLLLLAVAAGGIVVYLYDVPLPTDLSSIKDLVEEIQQRQPEPPPTPSPSPIEESEAP